MLYGGNEAWRVWGDMRRKEEELKCGPYGSGAGRHFDSMGRPASTSSSSDLGWARQQLGRVERVRRALEESGPAAKRLVADRIKGIDLT